MQSDDDVASLVGRWVREANANKYTLLPNKALYRTAVPLRSISFILSWVGPVEILEIT
jgi:hypothetical protein